MFLAFLDNLDWQNSGTCTEVVGSGHGCPCGERSLRTSHDRPSGGVHFPRPSGVLVLEIGLVMLQGSRQAHDDAIRRASERMGFEVNIREIRTPDDLLESTLQALILPWGVNHHAEGGRTKAAQGSWSTYTGRLREKPNFPVLATCAGAILLADPQDGGPSIIKATVDRNAWGRQIDSF